MWISANEAAEAFAGVDAIKHSFEHLYTAVGLFDSSKSGVARKEDMCAVLAEVGLQLLPNQVRAYLRNVPRLTGGLCEGESNLLAICA